MNLKKRFNLATNRSPTFHNIAKQLTELGWTNIHTNLLSQFDERNFEYNPEAAQWLEYKHLLNLLATQYNLKIQPDTFHINDDNWRTIVNRLPKDKTWILKPSTLNNGEHILIFQSATDVERHYAQNNRMGGEHVLQEYITNPHLVKGPQEGHKYSIRMFVVLTNYAGAYLYPEGYFNIALKPYQPNNFDNLAAHLTNEHLKHDVHNVIQIPTSQYKIFKPLYPKIKTIATTLTSALENKFASGFIADNKKQIAIFGFDFMADQAENVWLLEANHAPCFPIDPEHPLQQKLYNAFWKSVVTRFVEPIANNQKPISKTPFEKLL